MSRQKNTNTTLLLELGDRLRRSWWTVIAGACLGLAGGNLALQYLPKVYEATTRIWITEQEISEGVVRSTVKDDAALKMAAFRDAVLADEYMISLIGQTFGMPTDDEELTQRMAQVRSNVVINTVHSQRIGVQAFSLAYRDEDPYRAANVVNTLTSLFVRQSGDLRMESAVKIADAIQKMADDAKAGFDVVDAKLTRFKQQHQFETEQHLPANLQMMEGRKRDVEALRARRDLLWRDQKTAEEDMEEARAQVGAEITPGGAIVIDPLMQQVARARRELEELRVRYTDTHPEVKRKRRELNDLLGTLSERSQGTVEGGQPKPTLPVSPAIAAVQTRLDTIGDQLAKLDSDERLLRGEIAEYERRIQVLPEVQRQLTELEEEHTMLQAKWRKLERDADDARGAIGLEESDMAEGMEVLTMASVPRAPIQPDPMQVYVIFLGFGMVLFVGPMLARHALNPPITSVSGLRALVPVPVLITVPRIATPENRGLARKNHIKNFAFSILACAVLALVKIYF